MSGIANLLEFNQVVPRRKILFKVVRFDWFGDWSSLYEVILVPLSFILWHSRIFNIVIF